MKKIFLLCIVINMLLKGYAQQPTPLPVTDSLPALYEGLKAGYTITEQSEKEVGSKGNFSRYKIKFFVTNTGSEAKIFLTKSQLFNRGNANHYVAEFRCGNATGARLTSKTVLLELKSCVIEALVDDKECGTDKVNKNQRLVDVGYWIKGGETISSNVIMIVPLNEKPDVAVTFYPYNNGIVGNISNNDIPANNNYAAGFVRIKNFTANNYLHIQNGPLACTNIDHEWWSAQWEIIPVNGTSYFQLRNRWKNNFISTENNVLVSDNGQNTKAMWTIEEASTSNTFYIKNVADNSKLVLQNNSLKTTNSYINPDAAALWIIEK